MPATAKGYRRSMLSASLIVAVAMALSAPPRAEDPAVRVCEMLVKVGLRSPESFARVAEPAVEGNEVAFTFSFANARGNTVIETRACRFRRHGDGWFHVEPFRRDYLATRMAAARAKLRTVTGQNETMLVRSEILDIGREMFVQDDRKKKAERLAAKAGIYPIAPGATRLHE